MTPSEHLQNALDIIRAAKNLTVMENREDGCVVIGPIGWAKLQEALAAEARP